MKAKKFFVIPAVKEDEILISLSTIKDWGIVGINFFQPNTNTFFESSDFMDLKKCKIASLEITNNEVKDYESSETKTEDSSHQTLNSDPERITDPEETVIQAEECRADKAVAQEVEQAESENNELKINQDLLENEKFKLSKKSKPKKWKQKWKLKKEEKT